MTPIDVRNSGGEVHVWVHDPDSRDAPLLTLTGRPGRGLRMPPLSLVLYSRLAGEELRTTVDVSGRTHVLRPGSVRLHVGVTDHPLSTTLRRLGLEGARPFVVSATNRFRSRLNRGVPTGRALPTTARQGATS